MSCGYKPSYGHFAVAGMKANTEWLDTIGAYARSVEDIALFRAALMAMPYVPIARLDKPPRIAVCFTHHKSELSPEGLAAVEDAAVQLAKAGAQPATGRSFEGYAARRWSSRRFRSADPPPRTCHPR